MSDVTKIQNPSITPKDFTIQDNKIIAISGIPVSGAGGTMSDYVYYPSFDETNGNITFTLGTTQEHPGPYGPYHISGDKGEQGASGYTPEFRINPDNEDHWEWRYTEVGGKWHDLGIAASGIEGPRGPQGVPGLDGKSLTASVDSYSNITPSRTDYGYTVTIVDGTGSSKHFNLYSPTVSTAVIPSGNRVTFTYAGSQSTYIDVMSGAKGDTGTSGISPVITTATIGAQEGHSQGGTEVTVFDIDNPDGQSFIVWNGINGQGATVELKGDNGIDVTKNGNEYIIAVSVDYATKAYTEEASAAAYNKAHAEIPTDYYHKSETSGANEIATALAKKLDKVDLPNYDGEDGIYVDDTNHKIGISADYKTQIEAVSGKLTPPVTAVDVDNHRLYNANSQAWEPLDAALNDEGVLLKQDLNTVLKPTNGISGNYNNSEYTFGLSAEYENAIKAVSGKVNAPPAGATGKKVYNAGNSTWEPFIITLPMNIGNNNTVTEDSIGAIGKNCSVGSESMAISYDGASAYQNSMAFGDGNFASANSMAAGWGVKATDYSVIFGRGTTSVPSEVRNYSFAAGDAVFAYNYSQAFGRGLVMSGSTDASHGFGGMVIGGWNKTSADVLFVAGNGSNSDAAHRSDAFILYPDGSVIEGYNNTFTNLGVKQATHIEGAFNHASAIYSHVEGHANAVSGYGIHVQGGYNQFYINNLSADTTHTDATNRWDIWGISIEGMANATSAEPTSGTFGESDYGYVHGGILKVIGNGTRTKEKESDPESEVITRSDALILYRDGTMSAAGKISAAGIELGGKLSIPINIGSNNALNIPTADYGIWGNNADGYLVIGNNSKAGNQSYVFGNDSIAQNNSVALNGGNSALHDSIAQGWKNTAIERSQAFGVAVSATNYSFAAGHGYNANPGSIVANNHSFALGVGSIDEPIIANEHSFSFGYGTSAQHYAFAFGKAIDVEGSDGHAVIGVGRYNTKVQNAAIIVGNGTNNARNNAFVVYNNGNVSAKNYKAEGYTQNNTYVEASVPKSLPNTGDNTMVVQKMFVCTSDPDIVAHVALANGEGCIFFRVGS